MVIRKNNNNIGVSTDFEDLTNWEFIFLALECSGISTTWVFLRNNEQDSFLIWKLINWNTGKHILAFTSEGLEIGCHQTTLEVPTPPTWTTNPHQEGGMHHGCAPACESESFECLCLCLCCWNSGGPRSDWMQGDASHSRWSSLGVARPWPALRTA